MIHLLRYIHLFHFFRVFFFLFSLLYWCKGIRHGYLFEKMLHSAVESVALLRGVGKSSFRYLLGGAWNDGPPTTTKCMMYIRNWITNLGDTTCGKAGGGYYSLSSFFLLPITTKGD